MSIKFIVNNFENTKKIYTFGLIIYFTKSNRMYLEIRNTGVLNHRFIELMGATTKRGDTEKIGKFGTGLKYAIARLLSTGHKIFLYTDGESVEFGTEEEEIQGHTYHIITINGRKTGITTEMGPDWQTWMAIREIWCNAIDEEHAAFSTRNGRPKTESTQGETVWLISMSAELEEIIRNWNHFFLTGEKPIWENTRYAIYENNHPDLCRRIYKNGILIEVADCLEPSLYKYDDKVARIDEMRKLSTDGHILVLEALNAAPAHIKTNVLRKAMEVSEPYVFYGFMGGMLSDTWAEALVDRPVISSQIAEKIFDEHDINTSKHTIIPNEMYDAFKRKFETILKTKTINATFDFMESPNEETATRISIGIEDLKEMGYEVSGDLQWIVGSFISDRTLAMLSREDQQVLVSHKLGKKPMSKILEVIVEENERYITGYLDRSRDFQTHFISLYVRELAERSSVAQL